MLDFVQSLIMLAVGGVLGGVIGWLIGRSGNKGSDGALEKELRQQLYDRESELNRTRGEAQQVSNSLATAQANEAAAERMLEEQRKMHAQALTDAKAAQEKSLADLREAFRAMSAEALKQSAPDFLRLAEQSFGKLQEAAKGDLTLRQESIKTLVEPLKQQLEVYQKRLQQSETTQSTTLGELKKQLETLGLQSQSLANETLQFRMVLKSNQARGKWGEETLRRVVEAAGMSAHCDFSEQIKEGDSKPDLIVHLPGDRMIIVDAKVPDLDFLNAMDTADTLKRTEALAIHAKKLKETIKALGDRDYPHQFANALDYVVLFLPAESLFSAALEGDQDLIVWAASKKILLTTPASLIALLRSVSVSWQQHAQTVNARDIAEAAEELYSRVTKFAEHFEKVRDGLEKANDAYNKAVGSYERMVRPQGEKIQKLRAATSEKELPDIQSLDTTLRLPPQS